MGLPTYIDVDQRIGDAGVVARALESTDVTPLADERLSRLHRVLYPVFRVTYSYTDTDDEGGFLVRNEQGRTDRILIDGLWSGNDSEIAPYTDGTVDTESVPTGEYDIGVSEGGPGRTILLGFQAANEHAAALLPDRVEHYLADNGYDENYAADLRATFDFDAEFDFERFDDVVDVTRVYLPFWLAEFHDGDEENAVVRSFRTLDDVRRDSRAHQWLGDSVSEDPARLAEYARGTNANAGASDSSDDSGERVAPERPEGDREVTQPDGIELDAERILDAPPRRSFADVGGMDDLVETLSAKVLDPLERPEAYEEYGIGTVTGVLLHGPPGCGKTYVAGALAGELGYNVIELDPADITSRYIGQAADNVAAAFEIARANQPCLVFVDEIDAVAGTRDDEMSTSEQQMVNQFLTELEAVADEDVVVLAATNRIDDVDRAIRRSGRFDERIQVPPPDADARREILHLYLDERPTAEGIDLDEIVADTAGYAASDVEQVADEAARKALREGVEIGEKHLRSAVEEARTSIPDWEDAVGEGDVDVTEPAGADLDAHRLVEPDPDRTFADVGGMDDLIERLERTVIHPQTNAEAYEEYDIGVTDGVLLHGPPGCGKTYVAGALAGELGHAFLPVTPADVTSKWMGRPAKNVADLFAIARANDPCVLFIDEIDAIAGSRAGEMNTSEQQMVNQLLTELESLGEDDDVLVLAATNLLEDVDRAIRRSGRFDERVEVPPPDSDARREILDLHLEERPTADDIDWAGVVAATAGYAASDLELLAETAARRALRADEPVGTDHLLAAAESTASSIAGWTDDGADDESVGNRYIR